MYLKKVALFRKHYPKDVIQSALILHWAKVNTVQISNIEKGAHTAELLHSSNPKASEKLLDELTSTVDTVSLKDVEGAFEILPEISKQREHGAVYTPRFIIDYLITEGLRLRSGGQSAPNICDPACGSGGFLIGAADFLREHYGIPPDAAFDGLLAGLDSDESAIRQAACLIELYLASSGVTLPGPQLRLSVCDSLLTGTEDILQSLGFPDGCDLVATNPPYIKLQNMEPDYREQLLERYAGFLLGNFSASPLFLVAGQRLLASGGCLAMITQNNLYTSLSGQPIREYLQRKRVVRRIVDFGSHRVFKRARAYTCLLFVGTDGSDEFQFSRMRGKASYETLQALKFTPIRNSELSASKWRLGTRQQLDNLKLIESTGNPLGTVAKISVGFATLKDEVYFVREEDNACIGRLPDGTMTAIEPQITRPAVKIAELHSDQDHVYSKRRIIFPYRKDGSRFSLIDEDELANSFPKTYEYLVAWKSVLRTRDKGRKQYPKWYAWARTQGMEAQGPKLLTKTFDRGPHFYLDTSDQLLCNGYSVSLPLKRSSAEVSIELLHCILNSKVMHYYARLTSFQIEGEFECYQKNFIERFGIPELTPSEAQHVISLRGIDRDKALSEIYGIPWRHIEDLFCQEADKPLPPQALVSAGLD
ncbi:MAG: SAM-dependent DNA methyltransferase [Chloroflexi bacterium]|nr:SAM-dependent DNA methyltransferase [Chloroflexota bacterium]